MKKYIVTIITLFFIIAIAIVGYFVYGNIKESKANSSEMLKEKSVSEIEYLGDNIIYVMNELNNISYTNYKIVSEEIEDSGSNEESSSSGSSSEQGGSEEESSSGGSKQGDSRQGGSGSTITTTTMSNANNILDDDSTEDIDWNSVDMKIQDMYSTWTTIMIDLSSLNVNKDNLLKFNGTLDKISSSIEQKDKENILINCSDLYNLLSGYISEFSADSTNTSVYSVKSNILYSYSEMERDNWEEAGNYIKKADENFSNILNNQINNIYKIDIINKAYVLLNELQEDCNSKDRKVFLINYSNLMQELQNI